MSRIMIWRRAAAPRHGFCWGKVGACDDQYSRQDAAPGERNPDAVSGEG